MDVAMVMAMDRNRLIGKEGGLPWKISADLKYFKRITMGKPIIMGRKTWDSIGRPLPGRTNIVVTRNSAWGAEGALVANDLDGALMLARQHLGDVTECCIIGGAQLCDAAMPRTDQTLVPSLTCSTAAVNPTVPYAIASVTASPVVNEVPEGTSCARSRPINAPSVR